MTELALFAVAKEALAELRRVDEVKDVRDRGERMRLYGQQVKDRSIIADATEIILRAERRLGEMIIAAKADGHLSQGGRPRSNLDETGTDDEQVSRVTLEEVGISRKLSASSQKLAGLEEAAFEAAMASARERIVSGGAIVVNPLKDVSTADKKARRAQREAELGAKQQALPEAKFGVIYADPEWKFTTYSAETGMDRSADNHYPTSELEEIKARDVGSLAADDCVLFLWATVPMLPQAIEVMKAWGFTYKSNFNWHKDRIGTGYWSRNRHEHLLIGARGNVPAPAMGDQFDSSIEAELGEHSAKPEKFYEIIEAYFPTLPKIELNARVARPGWVRWGYEAPPADEAAAPTDFAAVADARDLYETAIAALGEAKGRLVMATAEPVLRLGRTAGVSPVILADDLGHPLGTVKAWLNRLGLTSMAHMQQLNAERAAAAAERRVAE